jgi:hypothetical protein
MPLPTSAASSGSPRTQFFCESPLIHTWGYTKTGLWSPRASGKILATASGPGTPSLRPTTRHTTGYWPTTNNRKPSPIHQARCAPPIAPRRRPFRPHFTYLFRLALARSRCARLRTKGWILDHLTPLVPSEALFSPATSPKFLKKVVLTPASEMGFHVELGLWGYITAVQWVQDGSKVNQSPGVTTPCVVGFNSKYLGQRLFGCSRAYIAPI